MKFEDRYNLKEIQVGPYNLAQYTPAFWEYVQSKDQKTGCKNIVYLCFMNEYEGALSRWVVCIQNETTGDFLEFKSFKIERAIELAENYLRHNNPFAS